MASTPTTSSTPYSISAHPKTRLFITHAGYNSLLESTAAGVPMVFTPAFLDQYANTFRAERHGVGLFLDMKDENINADMVYDKINKVLSDHR